MAEINIRARLIKLGYYGIGVGLMVFVLCNIYILVSTNKSIVEEIDNLTPAQTIIVLGAGVNSSGTLSPILKDRVDTAVLAYRAGKAKRILVSGDNSTYNYNEVVPVHKYLIEQDIPVSHIFLDYAGFNTYDSMYRARDVFDVTSAIVVTQGFHLPRAVYIGKALDIEIQGLPSGIKNISFKNHFRESLARVKSVLEVIAHRQPKFLGETISIDGDGRETID